MGQTILIFLPGNEPKLGLYRTDAKDNWILYPIVPGQDGNVTVRSITNLLRHADVTIRNLTAIGIFPGPAPYAQLRTHITTANALSWVLGTPIFTLSDQDRLPLAITVRQTDGKVGQPIEPIYPSHIN